ncbi:putative two-component histidine kinase [Streptomyces sp. NBRC 110611]|uniref:sensor histidine kinase n=1 Tax=Streptomyces sp. NBRC 110611 TaxID=1621259 RepID=UPI00082F05A2|nr:histidine kinase [Streptomyces sp. NBRC 110611]GAU66454.1 putative two-component histidine kinase [Streptomyces sp. NBRC 110611]
MPSSAPPTAAQRPPTRSPFTGPGEQGRQLWRAAGETALAGLLVLLTYQALDWYQGQPSMLAMTLDGSVMVALALVGIGLVLVRRRFPAWSLLGLSALMGLFPATGLLTAVASYTAARQTEARRRRGAVLLAGLASAMLAGFASAPDTGLGSRPYGLVLGAVLAATTVLIPGLVGTAGGQQDRLVRALRERTAAAEEARRLADSEARMHERSRIAAEMHDLVGHRLSLISLHAGGLEMALQEQAPELREEAALVRGATRDAMRELREALGVLGPLGRDTGTDALTDATGTRPDIEALVAESRGVGVPVEFSWDGDDLDARPARVRRAVHRVVREALTNVHRYAAGAHVTVAVTHTGERVKVQARNGVPPVPPAATTGLGSGRGLTGLRERVALLGGTLEAGPTPGGGFSVTADIPADPASGAQAEEAEDGAAAAPHEERPQGSTPVRADRRLQRGLTSAAVGLLGLAGVGAMMLFGVILVNEARPSRPYHPFEPRVGMTREQVQREWITDNDIVRAAAAGREPHRPASATDCMYPWVDTKAKGGRLPIVRYCFRSDILISIDRFTVPVVTEPQPPRGSRTHD